MKRQICEGRAGQPKISIDSSLIERFGEPRADFDGLADLFFDTFKIPRKEEEPIIHLYQSKSRMRRGYHIHFSHTVHINAASGGDLIDPLPALLHETKHMSDRYNKLPKLLGGIGTRMAIAGAPAELNLARRAQGRCHARPDWLRLFRAGNGA